MIACTSNKFIYFLNIHKETEMKKKWLAHDTNSGWIRHSPPYKPLLYRADAKDKTMVDTVTCPNYMSAANVHNAKLIKHVSQGSLTSSNLTWNLIICMYND